jgi:hypothetical protein
MNTTATMDVLANDLFSNRNDLVLTAASPAHGSVTTNSRRDILYTPATGFTGRDSFTYQIAENGNTNTATVTVGVVSQPPVATNFNVSVSWNTMITTNATAQAYSPNGYPLNVISVGPATYGLTMISTNNIIIYLAEPGYTYSNWPGILSRTISPTRCPMVKAGWPLAQSPLRR